MNGSSHSSDSSSAGSVPDESASGSDESDGRVPGDADSPDESSPVEPVSLTATAAGTSIQLDWSGLPEINVLNVYYNTIPNPLGATRLDSLSVSEQSYTVTGLESGTSYWFWLQYRTVDNQWMSSSAASATPSAVIPDNPLDENAIVVSTAAEILAAIESVKAGDTIYIRGGTYSFDETIRLAANGTASSKITFSKHPQDSTRPLFDFSSMSENSSNRGFNLRGNYWYIYGIDVAKAGDNGMFIRGSNNILEFSSFYENADTGVQLGNGASDNLILNVDSYFNADSSLENADGFAAKLDVGSGNRFDGCRAWNNLDDGFDGYLRGADNVTTVIENSWVIRNGYLKDGSLGAGDGNGFKTGGSDGKDLKHNLTLINTIAAGNAVDGYDHNSNRGKVVIYNAIAHKNGRNIYFGAGNIIDELEIKNTISYDGNNSDRYEANSTDISNNSWQDITFSENDFESIDIDDLLAERQADGSLPVVDYFKLRPGSSLIDAGINVGESYNGTAPDIGAFESD